MINEKKVTLMELTKKIPVVCPKCKKSNKINIPLKIIDQSDHLTTVSIPSGLVCEHTFQAYVDKRYKVRGYQKVDYELSKMEFLHEAAEASDTEKSTNQQSSLASLPLFQDIIKLLRNSVDDREIIGTGLFTLDGKVLYSSLPQSTLFNTIREFEVREKKHLTGVKKILLELQNDQKICGIYMKINNVQFVLVLFLNAIVRFGMGILLLTKLTKKIEGLI